jgi:2-(1,2-epoxy-1,2-dihydrophenyl)acetyl-CoA isomerase
MSGVLLETLEDGLFTLTLNRPERRNALDPAILQALVEATRRAATNPAVSAVVLTGAGGTSCVGGDVKAMAARGNEAILTDDRIADLRERMEAARLLHEMRKPTIAAIEGAAAGAGLSLALACDLRIANRSAKLTTAFVKVALSGDFGGTYFLTKLLGSAKARELYLTSPILSAEEALQIGLVTRVFDDAGFQEAAKAYAMAMPAGRGLPSATSSTISISPNLRRLKPASTTRQSTTHVRRRPRIIGKRPQPSSRSGRLSSKGADKRPLT